MLSTLWVFIRSLRVGHGLRVVLRNIEISVMTLFNKIKWILGIVLVFVVVLTTNLIDRKNFNIVSDSIETIYADRLVAKEIIYDLSKEIGAKEVAYIIVDSTQLVGHVNPMNVRIKESVELFSNTKLTDKEEIVFSRLGRALRELQEIEVGLAAGAQARADLGAPLALVREHLDELSLIQMEEARRELHSSKRAINAANLFTQLEIAALVVMAILVQLIIIYTPKSKD